MKQRTVWAGFVAVALLSLLPPTTARAATTSDRTGPWIQLEETGQLVVGHRYVDATRGYGPGYIKGYADFAIKWHGSDPSGICVYQLWTWDHGGGTTLWYSGRGTAFRFTASDDFDGAGYNDWFFELRAKDCAGNWSRTSTFNDDVDFPKTDRYIKGPGGDTALLSVDDVPNPLFTPSLITTRFSSGWSTGTCICFAGSTRHQASAAGAWMTATTGSSIFGWVAERGPGMGQARVYDNGVLKATVDLYSPRLNASRVVWAYWSPGSRQHTIRIVVVGTTGHPQVNVDAFAF